MRWRAEAGSGVKGRETLKEDGGDAVIAVRPYIHTDHYWHVYFDTNEAIVRPARRPAGQQRRRREC